MKNYKKMAEDVFFRRDEYLNAKRRMVQNVAASATALICVLVVALSCISIWESDSPGLTMPVNPTVPQLDVPQHSNSTTEPASESLPIQTNEWTLLLAASLDSEGQELREDLLLPLNYLFLVRDIRGFAQQEIEQTYKEASAYIKEQNPFWRANTRVGKNVILSTATSGAFQLMIDDYSIVESIEIMTQSGYGKVCVCLSDDSYPTGTKVVLLPGQIPEEDKQNKLIVDWRYSQGLMDALEADPTVSLSEFCDTVTFSVTYQDGRMESCVVDIVFQDDGTVYASYQGVYQEVR